MGQPDICSDFNILTYRARHFSTLKQKGIASQAAAEPDFSIDAVVGAVAGTNDDGEANSRRSRW